MTQDPRKDCELEKAYDKIKELREEVERLTRINQTYHPSHTEIMNLRAKLKEAVDTLKALQTFHHEECAVYLKTPSTLSDCNCPSRMAQETLTKLEEKSQRQAQQGER